jgi:hypothetical protein
MENNKEQSQQVVLASELVQDDHNFNKGTAKGKELLRKSLTELGAGRSVLIDKDNRLIAGNKTQEIAAELGMKVRIIETDGTELIAVKRTDLDIDSKKGRELALADNAVTKMNLVFDHTELTAEQLEVGLDPNQWGVPNLAPDEDEEPEYQVVINVDNEQEQEKLYNRLTKQGYECKIINV